MAYKLMSKKASTFSWFLSSEQVMWDPYNNTKANKLSWARAHLVRLSFSLLLVAALIVKYFLMYGS